MTTTALGGAINIGIECSACKRQMDFKSDPKAQLKYQVAASCQAARIPHAKYQRFGTCLGKRIESLFTFSATYPPCFVCEWLTDEEADVGGRETAHNLQ